MFLPDLADFGAFYERTYQRAFRTALGIVHDGAMAADVTQEAFVVAYEQRGRFRGEGPAHIWLHKIVVNRALAELRRRGPIVRELSMVERGSVDHAHATTDRLVLFAALGALSPRYRAAVVLRYYHDYDYATIGHILGTSSTNMGAMLSRARDRLKLELDPAPAAAVAIEEVIDAR